MPVTMSGYPTLDDYGDPALIPNPVVPTTSGILILGGLRSGSVATCLLYIAARMHGEVEPLLQAQGQWGFERRKIAGSGSWSDHAAGAAADLNATLHPSHAAGTFTQVQLSRITAIESVVSSAMEWGGRWSPSSLDAMHWQVRNGHAGVPVDDLAALIRAGHVPRVPAELLAPVSPPVPTHKVPSYPFVRGDGRYFGPFSGPAESISGSGRNDAPYRPALALWQAQVTRRGFGTVKPDGYFGPITETAARRLQSAAGLSVDGLIGWDTWNAAWL